jgi:hypothetical protein
MEAALWPGVAVVFSGGGLAVVAGGQSRLLHLEEK